MKKPRISCVVAISKHDRGIGNGNQLLWHLPNDMKRFRNTTIPHPIIMGRKTYESLPEKYRPLPKRPNIILTRDTSYPDNPITNGADVVHTLDDAIALASKYDNDEIFIGGGQQIYELALPQIDRLYLTLVDSASVADTFFPEYADQFTNVLHTESGVDNDHPFEYMILERG